MQKYLDANIFIFPVVESEEIDIRAKLSKEILSKATEGYLDAATSALTWDELVWAVKKFIGEKESIEEGNKFLQLPNLKILEVDTEVLLKAQELMSIYKLRPRDSIHAACAIKNNIRQIISDDPDFDKVKEIERISLEKANEI